MIGKTKPAVIVTAWTFRRLHRHGIVRALSSTSSNTTDAPVTVRLEAWPRVPEWAVGRLADHRFAEIYPSKARSYYRQQVVCGRVTVAGRRQWTVKYASAAGSPFGALGLSL